MKIIFTLFLVGGGGGGGGLLKLDIAVCKVNVLTYTWSFSENLENYRKQIL